MILFSQAHNSHEKFYYFSMNLTVSIVFKHLQSGEMLLFFQELYSQEKNSIHHVTEENHLNLL